MQLLRILLDTSFADEKGAVFAYPLLSTHAWQKIGSFTLAATLCKLS